MVADRETTMALRAAIHTILEIKGAFTIKLVDLETIMEGMGTNQIAGAITIVTNMAVVKEVIMVILVVIVMAGAWEGIMLGNVNSISLMWETTMTGETISRTITRVVDQTLATTAVVLITPVEKEAIIQCLTHSAMMTAKNDSEMIILTGDSNFFVQRQLIIPPALWTYHFVHQMNEPNVSLFYF